MDIKTLTYTEIGFKKPHLILVMVVIYEVETVEEPNVSVGQKCKQEGQDGDGPVLRHQERRDEAPAPGKTKAPAKEEASEAGHTEATKQKEANRQRITLF